MISDRKWSTPIFRGNRNPFLFAPLWTGFHETLSLRTKHPRDFIDCKSECQRLPEPQRPACLARLTPAVGERRSERCGTASIGKAGFAFSHYERPHQTSCMWLSTVKTMCVHCSEAFFTPAVCDADCGPLEFKEPALLGLEGLISVGAAHAVTAYDHRPD